MSPFAPFLLLAVAYLSGSIPFGLLVARAHGVDVRREGSGNIGATNVARTVGKRAGMAVLLLDAAKGALPIWLAQLTHPSGGLAGYLLPACGFAAVVGHCFPVWLRLRGGKGVATGLGVFLMIDPAATAIALVVFCAVFGLFRVVSAASLTAATSLVVAIWVLARAAPVRHMSIAIVVLIVLLHHQNIARIVARREPEL